jgi:hypothetical protein
MDGPANFAVPADSAEPPVVSQPVASGLDQAASAPAQSAGADVKSPYPSAAPAPTQAGPEGIRFDFNHGWRVLLPNRTEGMWRVRLRDLDTHNVLFQSDNQGALVRSAKRWFVRASASTLGRLTARG